MKLNIFNQLPDHFFKLKVEQLHSILGGPSIIHLKNKNKPTVFISTLIHGNEHSGFVSLQKTLSYIFSKKLNLNFSLILFIGNTLAAQTHQRHLPQHPDFNRVWYKNNSEWGIIAQEVLNYARQFEILYNLDIHNSTGKNPFYTCINKLDQNFLDLASYFSQHIVYFTEPKEVQSNAFSSLCPSITIEAGQSMDKEGIECLFDRLTKLLTTDDTFQGHFKHHHHLVYRSLGRFIFNTKATIDFNFLENSQNDFSFDQNIDDYNLQIYEKGQVLAFVHSNSQYLKIMSQNQENIFHDFLEIQNKQLIVKKPFVPSLLSKNLTVIQSDCFGYLMEIYPI